MPLKLIQQLLSHLLWCCGRIIGDDVATRRSSAGYVFMLYGMPIDWKATVLRSVTHSTTEAELYALSAAGVESQY
jgi:hypothetical protein